jgi:hypothetical protein
LPTPPNLLDRGHTAVIGDHLIRVVDLLGQERNLQAFLQIRGAPARRRR